MRGGHVTRLRSSCAPVWTDALLQSHCCKTQPVLPAWYRAVLQDQAHAGLPHHAGWL